MLAINDYDIVVVTEPFVTGADFILPLFEASWWNFCDALMYKDPLCRYVIEENEVYMASSPIDLEGLQDRAGTLEHLSNEVCMERYANDFLANRRNVVVVSSNTSSNNSLLHAQHYKFSNAYDLRHTGVHNSFTWLVNSEAQIVDELLVL